MAPDRLTGDAARVTDEQREQRPLGRAQLHFNIPAFRDVRDDIDFEIAVPEDAAFLARLGAALGGAEAGEEFDSAERFRHVVVGTSIERGDFVALVIAHGQHLFDRMRMRRRAGSRRNLLLEDA